MRFILVSKFLSYLIFMNIIETFYFFIEMYHQNEQKNLYFEYLNHDGEPYDEIS